PTAPSKIINNMIIGGTYGLYFSTASDIDIFHNSIVGGSRGVYFVGTCANMDIRNNIMTSNNNGHAFYASTTLVNGELDYNIYFTGGSLLARNGTTDYADLTAWKTAQSGLNVNSIEGDPGFTSPSDLHILGSLPNDVGDNTVGVSIDFDDETRPASGSTVVDIGADEYTPANCLPVTNFRLTSSGVGTATVKWDTVSFVQNYVIEYGPNGFTPGNGTVMTSTSDSAVISGLPANNLVHEAYIRVYCGGSDSSVWVGPILLLTEAILCTDDFEAYSTGLIEGQSTLFFGWANQGGDGAVSTTVAKSGTKSMRVYNSGPNGYTDIVAVFPALTSGAHKLKWDFYVPTGFGGYYNIQQNYVGGGTGNIWALEVYILANGTVRVEPGSFGSGAVGTFNYNVGQWNTLEHIIDLDNDTAFIVCNGVPTNVGWQFSFGSTTNPIQFNGVNFYSTADPGQTPNYYVDDFCVEPYNFAACTPPISVSSSNIGCDTAEVTWVSGLNTISSFLEYGPSGFTPGTGTVIQGSSPIQLNGLSPGTAYDVVIWDTCASGYSDTSAVHSFTTA
ncbi:MAG: hypothetical protein LPK46_07030, partial [Bacteroidota bacterium]|nr:hypothetical protein [Bacteroidota bacterium]MDX5505874.1 hypothetical protein [Bacteroidota bacterium]